LFLPAPGLAQEARLIVTVFSTDFSPGQTRIPDAQIRVWDARTQTVVATGSTDNDGMVVLEVKPFEHYEIQATREGFISLEANTGSGGQDDCLAHRPDRCHLLRRSLWPVAGDVSVQFRLMFRDIVLPPPSSEGTIVPVPPKGILTGRVASTNGLPLRDVRTQRRRAVRLLRQPGVHEHGGAALRGNTGRRQHGQHPAGRLGDRQRVRHGQEPAAHRHGPRHPVRRHGHGGRPARPRGQGRRSDVEAWRALPPRAGAVPARVGLGRQRHRARGPSRHPERPLPRLRGRARHGHPCHPIRRRVPVEEYLRLQTRFKHLFAGAGHPDVVAALQAQADRDIARFGLDPQEES